MCERTKDKNVAHTHDDDDSTVLVIVDTCTCIRFVLLSTSFLTKNKIYCVSLRSFDATRLDVCASSISNSFSLRSFCFLLRLVHWSTRLSGEGVMCALSASATGETTDWLATIEIPFLLFASPFALCRSRTNSIKIVHSFIFFHVFLRSFVQGFQNRWMENEIVDGNNCDR